MKKKARKKNEAKGLSPSVNDEFEGKISFQ
jgi:hypothetical protein